MKTRIPDNASERYVIIQNELSGEEYGVRVFDFHNDYAKRDDESWVILRWQDGEAYEERREHHHDYRKDEPYASDQEQLDEPSNPDEPVTPEVLS